MRWAGVFTILSAAVSVFLACEPPALTPNGVVGVFGDVGLGPGSFSYPRAIAAEPNGSVFVIDKNGRIQRFDENGLFETFWRMPQTEQGKPVGTVGDIVLADLSQYIVAEKDMIAAVSVHVGFLTDESAFRFAVRTDGMPSMLRPITPHDGGATRSAFVTLAART